jgi:hypothetical protein
VRATGRGEVFLTTFVVGTSLLGRTVAVTITFGTGMLTQGAFIGTVIDTPQAHFAFFPAIPGFHRNVLPHPPQEN